MMGLFTAITHDLISGGVLGLRRLWFGDIQGVAADNAGSMDLMAASQAEGRASEHQYIKAFLVWH